MPSLLPLRPAGGYPGPPLIGLDGGALSALQYAEHSNPVRARWRPLHEWIEAGDGSVEPFYLGRTQRAYRPFFSLGWNHLLPASAHALIDLLLSGEQILFAPYSDGSGNPVPAAFEVNLLTEVPDYDDLRTMRRPITLEFEGVAVIETAGEAPEPCGGVTNSGGSGVTSTVHSLGPNPGTVTLLYEMYTAQDQADILYNGVVVATTGGPVSGSGTLTFEYAAEAGQPQTCTVRITGASSGTAWNYSLSCPGEPPPSLP